MWVWVSMGMSEYGDGVWLSLGMGMGEYEDYLCVCLS